MEDGRISYTGGKGLEEDHEDVWTGLKESLWTEEWNSKQSRMKSCGGLVNVHTWKLDQKRIFMYVCNRF